MAKKICQRCGEEKSTASYIAISSPMFKGSLPICRQCLAKQLDEANKNGDLWNVANKICQWADIPFIPEYFQEIYEDNGRDAIGVYVSTFRSKPYDTLDWSQYNEVYLQLKEEEHLEDALPAIKAKRESDLAKKWGQHYDLEDMEYLENLHQGLLNSQNVIGALNEDQALKLCKISLIIEQKMRGGEDFTKDLKAYDELAKLSNLTPKNAKDAEDFSSFGEVGAYLEKTGFAPQYYRDAPKDEVDLVQKNIQLWNQSLYVGETGIAEEIEERINNLKIAAQLQGKDFNEQELRDYMELKDNEEEENEEDFVPDIFT